MTDQQPLTYEAATARLEAIIKRLDSGEAGLRETLDLVREGRGLVEFCAGELEAVGKGLEELRLEELVARLEGGRSPTGLERPDADRRSQDAGPDAPRR
jgi:exodeoxyribonuclease VII small subunit